MSVKDLTIFAIFGILLLIFGITIAKFATQFGERRAQNVLAAQAKLVTGTPVPTTIFVTPNITATPLTTDLPTVTPTPEVIYKTNTKTRYVYVTPKPTAVPTATPTPTPALVDVYWYISQFGVDNRIVCRYPGSGATLNVTYTNWIDGGYQNTETTMNKSVNGDTYTFEPSEGVQLESECYEDTQGIFISNGFSFERYAHTLADHYVFENPTTYIFWDGGGPAELGTNWTPWLVWD